MMDSSICWILIVMGVGICSGEENVFVTFLKEYDELREMYDYVFKNKNNHFQSELKVEQTKWDKKLDAVETFQPALDYLDHVIIVLKSINVTQTRVIGRVDLKGGSSQTIIKPSKIKLERDTKVPVNVISWIVKDVKTMFTTNTTVKYMVARKKHWFFIFVNQSLEIQASSSGETHNYVVDMKSIETEDSGTRLAWINYTVEMLKSTFNPSTHVDWINLIQNKENLLKSKSETTLKELISFRGYNFSLQKKQHIKDDKEEDEEFILKVPHNVMMSVRCDYVPFVRYSDGEHVLYSISWNGSSHPWFDFMSDNVLRVRGTNNYPILRTVVDRSLTQPCDLNETSLSNSCHYKCIQVNGGDKTGIIISVIMIVVMVLCVGAAILCYMRKKRLSWNSVKNNDEPTRVATTCVADKMSNKSEQEDDETEQEL